ncbi:hypothetical protein FGL01_17980 [Flavobacterium glycines]|uniref:Uncharacterized protein n=1 Tax=Flavobacterium glycines TaxID=551990 RepID=A0A511CER7_9FLAO|nr:hypothetical protein FGL01_17980 [Flavobacterium glycines]
MVKMYFKNEFVTHGKIDFFNLAIIKICRSKCCVVNFSGIKNAVVKLTIDKSNTYQIAIGKITIGKRTRFKFFKVEGFLTVADIVVMLVKEILGHCSNFRL